MCEWKNSLPPYPRQILYNNIIPSSWGAFTPPHGGLVNTGVSCFVNASIQALMHVPGFIDFLELDTHHRNSCFSLLNCLTCSLYRTCLNMRLHQNFKPVGLLNLLARLDPSFKLNVQQDAQEFMLKLTDHLEEELISRHGVNLKLDFCSKQTTAIGQIFGWWMVTRDVCKDCGWINSTYGPATFLSLPVRSSIQTAVTEYFVPEMVEKSCTPKCSQKKCIRHLVIHTYPNVLRIILNRFDIYGQKISKPVNVEHTIAFKDATYTLLSCVLHEGLVATEGHYTCLAYSSDGKMYLFDDSKVTDGSDMISSSGVQRNVYLAFYQLHHVKAPPQKRNHPTPANSPLHKKIHTSPIKKSLEKKTIQEKFRKKIGEFLNAVIPCQSKEDTDILAEPLPEINVTTTAKGSCRSARKRLPFSDIENVLFTKETVSKSSLEEVPVTGTAIQKVVDSPSKVSLYSESEPSCEISSGPFVEEEVHSNAEHTHTSSEVPVPPLKIQWRARTTGKETESQSDHSYIISSGPFVKKDLTSSKVPVPPLKIQWRARTTEKETESQSDHSYMLSSHPFVEKDLTSPKVPVPPLKIQWRARTTEKETESQSDHSYMLSSHLFVEKDHTLSEVPVPPLKIQWRTRTTGKETESQSDHSYIISSGPFVKKDLTSSKVPVPPLKIQWRARTTGKETESQSDHSYMISSRPCVDENSCSQAKRSTAPSVVIDAESVPQVSFQENQELPFIDLSTDQLSHKSGEYQNNLTQQMERKFIRDGIAEFIPIQLTTADVPEANLPNAEIEKNTVFQLQRWLKFRDIPTKGNKTELINKVKNYLAMGKQDFLDPKVDNGFFYSLKETQLLQSQYVACLNDNDVFLTDNWSTFPSRDMPNSYNFGSVYNYLIETMPQLHNTTNSSDDDHSEDEAEEVIEYYDPFEVSEGKEIICCKKLRRGLQFVKSGYVRNVEDSLEERKHLYQAQVRASMKEKAYTVKVAISQISGSIIRGACFCPQRSLGRCSHVSALLLHLLIHKKLNGPAAITSTSKPCSWNKGSLKHNPSVVNERQYESFGINIKRRAEFDPRPSEFQNSPSVWTLNNFLTDLQYKEMPCLFQTILSLHYEDFNYSEEDLKIYRTNREQMYEALSERIERYKPSPQYQGAFEIEVTRQQSLSNEWKIIRSLNCSAQPSRQIDRFKSENAKMNFLRAHLWGIDQIETKAMKYGKKKEEIARIDYIKKLLKGDPSAVVEECGLYLHTEHIELSCSPDGIIKSTTMTPKTKLLEIKTLYSHKQIDPAKFDCFLPKKKLKSFFLTRDETGSIKLKEDHPYYDQVQVSMGLLNLNLCDLFVWTEANSVSVTVPFDIKRWEELSRSLKRFHRNYLIPEYFAMRTPRNLKPLELQ